MFFNSLGAGNALEHQRQSNVFGRRHGGQQVVALKNKAQVCLAELGQLIFGHSADLVRTDEYLAAGRFFQPGQLIQQGAFATAGLAHDAAEFPFFNGDRNIVQGNDPFFAYGIHLAQVDGMDNGCHFSPPFLTKSYTSILYHILPPAERGQSCKIAVGRRK